MKANVLVFVLLACVVETAAAATAEKVVLSGAEAISKFPVNLRDSESAKLDDARWCELRPGVEYFYGKFSKLYNRGKEDVSVIRKDLLPAGVNELQHASEGSSAHWTVNHTIDGVLGCERKVCNQLLFVTE